MEWEISKVELYEDQVFNKQKWFCASPALINDAFHNSPDWRITAMEHGWVPYYDELDFIRWKLLRKNGMD
jgi:hypothetical protein